MEIGAHCDYKYCKQKDFLPFRCSQCKNSYCSEHRTLDNHECQNLIVQQKAIVCPICIKTIKYQSTLSENEIWEIHSATECDGNKYQDKIDQRQFCVAQNCNTELKKLNKHSCKHCYKEYCLKHRFPESHQCNLEQNTKNNQIDNRIQGSYNFNNQYNAKYLNTQWNTK